MQNRRHVMEKLPDLLTYNLKVVFCGTAAGQRSAELGAYYAGKGNKFWPVLRAVGFTDRRLEPAEYRLLPTYRIGLTDLAKFVSGADSTLKHADFDTARLRGKITEFNPAALAFTSKKAGKTFFGERREYGRQPDLVGRTRVYILPSPSGLASGFWSERWWRELADDLRAA
jgi:TDG/mug DNA glycosylase family protein